MDLSGSREHHGAATRGEEQEGPTDIYSAALAGLSGADADAAAARVSSEVPAPTPHPSMSHVSRVCVSGARGPVLSNLREPLPSPGATIHAPRGLHPEAAKAPRPVDRPQPCRVPRLGNLGIHSPTLSAFAPRSAAWGFLQLRYPLGVPAPTPRVSRHALWPTYPPPSLSPSAASTNVPRTRFASANPLANDSANVCWLRVWHDLASAWALALLQSAPTRSHLPPTPAHHPPTAYQSHCGGRASVSFPAPPLLCCRALHTAPSPAILLEGRGGVASAAPYRGESGATLVCSNVLRRVKPRPIKA
ncbi:hypothetical protein PCL_05326 [Purpureocillium lilacinum]|uniref:Uncharacterized protein n=1 Tax=Purpureocillium lilacinum TaxID=33203 RepID=A0A2U3DV29_PURLI|nr:hypothetical protein PCL_05326 [Purpureocillium lilacinum]